jgi:2-iminobutanoate/2-iminopropanoate deaminase
MVELTEVKHAPESCFPTLSIQVKSGGQLMRDIVSTKDAPTSPLYSQAVRAAGLIFVSGQAGQDPRTGQMAGPTIGEQVRQSLMNIKAILEAVGSSMEKIVSATFILSDPEDFGAFNAEWESWFRIDPPARQGAKMPVNANGLLVSIAVVAAE